MRFLTIASGSSGNSIFVGSDKTNILLDAGISGKKTIEGLKKAEIKPEEIDAILITHEHSDHIKGLGVLARKYEIPIYASKGTIKGILNTPSLGEIDSFLFNEIKAGKGFKIKDMVIEPVKVSHDAFEPLAYTFFSNERRAGVITDLGFYDENIIKAFSNLDVYLCEANHDVRMLEAGPYPYLLKRRILGPLGHLSNENSGQMISSFLSDNVKHIFLGHLSRENNLPELAYETVRLEITHSDTKYTGNDFPITVASRSEPGPLIEW